MVTAKLMVRHPWQVVMRYGLLTKSTRPGFSSLCTNRKGQKTKEERKKENPSYFCGLISNSEAD